jgi:CRP/FNR family transcriptional regulator
MNMLSPGEAMPIEQFPLWATELHEPFRGRHVTRVAAGCPLAFQGDQINKVHWIQSGSVCAYHAFPDGKRIVLGYWTPGMIVGLPGFSKSGETYLWSSEAKDPTEVISIERARFRDAIERSPKMQRDMLILMEMKVSMLSHLAQMLATPSATARLALVLRRLARSHGVVTDREIRIGLRLTHSDLSEMVGASRQWTSTALLKIKHAGIIDIARHRLYLLQPHRLDDLGSVLG